MLKDTFTIVFFCHTNYRVSLVFMYRCGGHSIFFSYLLLTVWCYCFYKFWIGFAGGQFPEVSIHQIASSPVVVICPIILYCPHISSTQNLSLSHSHANLTSSFWLFCFSPFHFLSLKRNSVFQISCN